MLNFITDFGKNDSYGLTCRKIHPSINQKDPSSDSVNCCVVGLYPGH